MNIIAVPRMFLANWQRDWSAAFIWPEASAAVPDPVQAGSEGVSAQSTAALKDSKSSMLNTKNFLLSKTIMTPSGSTDFST